MRTSNPALGSRFERHLSASAGQAAMTVDGTVHKTGFLILLVVLASAVSWTYADTPLGSLLLFGGLIAGLILALVTIFKPQWAVITAPLYALAEGALLGVISRYFDAQYPGLPVYALGLTIGTLLAMLMLYQTGTIKVTAKLRSGVMMATGAIFLFYLASFVVGFFGISMPLLHSSGPLGIIFSLVIVGVAAFNLLLDFDFIEKGAEKGAPRYMEWYGAFGLVVTLVWLYLEMLRLLAKLRD
ncbi:MAG TPA: Bax inhibitor-1/YccA family protein [Acidobacteriota bacterium]|nr:Bax inhibitor-1/YccA family protein [Acidobacteriota bacterium]